MPPLRWLMRGVAICLVAVAIVLVACAFVGRQERPARRIEEPHRSTVLSDQPVRAARPRHLTSTYVAPPRQRATSAGRLVLARLGIDVPVARVGWDGDAMAVPNDPGTLGWFSPSAAIADRAGASLIAGHVSDRHDRPGPLSRLVGVRIGDLIAWRAGSTVTRFRVVSVRRYPRLQGLPTSLFRIDGRHVLRLVTCTDRRTSVFGFHYADNLVVSAVET